MLAWIEVQGDSGVDCCQLWSETELHSRCKHRSLLEWAPLSQGFDSSRFPHKSRPKDQTASRSILRSSKILFKTKTRLGNNRSTMILLKNLQTHYLTYHPANERLRYIAFAKKFWQVYLSQSGNCNCTYPKDRNIPPLEIKFIYVQYTSDKVKLGRWMQKKLKILHQGCRERLVS